MIKIIPLTNRERMVLSGIFRKEGFHSGVMEYSNFDGRVPFNKIDSPTFHTYRLAYKKIVQQLNGVVELLEKEDLAAFHQASAQYQCYRILRDPDLHGGIQSELFHRYRKNYIRIHDGFVSYLNNELGQNITSVY
jgi:hypothetical protein